MEGGEGDEEVGEEGECAIKLGGVTPLTAHTKLDLPEPSVPSTAILTVSLLVRLRGLPLEEKKDVPTSFFPSLTTTPLLLEDVYPV